MRKYGLIGKYLGHSFSKKYFDSKFAADGSGRQFELFPLESINDLPALIKSEPGLKGLAVTIPYKQQVIPFLHKLHDSARLTGAVNCISIGDGLTGYNTDITGFELSLKPLLEAHHNKALIFGTGGSSMAVQYVLNKLRLPFLLVSRDGSKGITYSSLTEEMVHDHKVLINCTPVGMHPDESSVLPIPFNQITGKHLLFDLVYNPEVTRFLEEGIRRGAKTSNGLTMLEIQAETNLLIWEGGDSAFE